MKISVIIPVYNAEQYLERTIGDILAQTLTGIEFIFVNDGSTDESLDILNQVSMQVPNIKVLDKPNGGVSSARNAGIKVATGEYIGFIDADDSIKPDMYERLYKKALADNADVVCCGHVEKNDKHERLCYSGLNITLNRKEAIRGLIRNDVIGMSACTKLFRATVVDNISFDEEHEINEDRFYVYEALKRSRIISVLSEALYIYYQNEGSATHGVFSKKNLGWLYFSERIYGDIKENYPELVPESYADMVKSAYYILILYYSSNCNDKQIHELLVEKIKGSNLTELKEYVGIKILCQMYMVKFAEPLYSFIKKIKLRGKKYEED